MLGKSNGWAGEKWLDVRNLTVLGPVMEARLDLAVAKGCDGVEPDNIDGYTNSTEFPLTGANQITYNKWLAEKAHARNLSIGLKNDIDQATELEPYFDWALNEQCFQYRECDTLKPFIEAGKTVCTTEYSLATAKFCAQANTLKFMSMKKKLDLDASREVCWTGSGTPTPTPTSNITWSFSASSAKVGELVVVTWSSMNATFCSATGEWTGMKPISGPESVTMSTAGLKTFILSCTGVGGTKSVNKKFTVGNIVTPAPTSTVSNVKMYTTDTVNVQQTAGGTKISIQPKGAVGYKIGNNITSDNRTWIPIDFKTGTDGYVAEYLLTKVTSSTLDSLQSKINALMLQVQMLQTLLAELQQT